MVYALIALITLVFLQSALILKLSLSGFSRLSESHERTTQYTEGLVDRLMAGDYTTYDDRQWRQRVAKEIARCDAALAQK